MIQNGALTFHYWWNDRSHWLSLDRHSRWRDHTMNRSFYYILRSCRIARRRRKGSIKVEDIVIDRTWVHRGHFLIIASVTCSSMNLRISSSTPFSTSSHRKGIWFGSLHNLEAQRWSIRDDVETIYLQVSFIHSGLRQRKTRSSGLSTMTAYGQ